MKEFTPNKDTEKAEKQTIRPLNKYLKHSDNISLLREIQNGKTSKSEDKKELENGKVQNSLKSSVKILKPEEALVPVLEEPETQAGIHNQESVFSSKSENDTSFETSNDQSFTTKKDPNGTKTHPDTVPLAEITKSQVFNISGSGSDQSSMKETIATQSTENGRTNATIIEEIRISKSKSKGRSHVDTRLLRGRKGKSWFVALYRQTQYQGMEAANNCGTRTNPCYHLKTVVNKLKEGDTLILISDYTELISDQNELNHNTENAVESTS